LEGTEVEGSLWDLFLIKLVYWKRLIYMILMETEDIGINCKILFRRRRSVSSVS
jgi:hypothetical protein